MYYLSPQLVQPIILGLDHYKEQTLQLWLFVNYKTVNLRIKLYKAAVSKQGNSFDIPMFRKTVRY